MRPRRALLYMPGDDRRKIEKAAGLGVDVICMDLEDGVALNRKDQARATVVQALADLDFGASERLVRINAIGSGLESADLQAAVPARPDGIVIPKVSSKQDIEWAAAKLGKFEREHGLEHGSIRLLAIIESALGVVNLKKIARADARLSALIFGALDLAGDIGATPTPAADEVSYARQALVLHAAAFGLDAIDMVAVDFKDLDALAEQARKGAALGFTGKQIIHPAQVEIVQTAFTPTQEEIAAARHIVEAHDQHQAQGTGAFAIDGKMVDMPVVRAAERVLQRAGIPAADQAE